MLVLPWWASCWSSMAVIFVSWWSTIVVAHRGGMCWLWCRVGPALSSPSSSGHNFPLFLSSRPGGPSSLLCIVVTVGDISSTMAATLEL